MCINKKSKKVALKVINLIIVLIIISSVKNYAQDIHFSQLKSTPLFINPANTGTNFSDFRFTNDYRNQWQKIDDPYNTLMLAFDTRIKTFSRQSGIGAMMVHDQSLSSYVIADKFYLSFSHSFFYKNHRFIMGIQPGYVLKKIDSNILTYGNQFDFGSQTFNPDLNTNENDLNEDLKYFDLNGGFLWQSRIKTLITSIGVGINHINRPVETFFTNEPGEPLPLKFTFHGNIIIPISQKYSIEPQALYSYTKGSKEFVGGALFSYYPVQQNTGLKKIYGISALRINPIRNFDALILGTGIEIAGFDICFSYDINISSLREVSRYQGAYEISLVFNANRKQSNHKAEPCFML